jgi:endonuclease/exonuclease/phosphatase (EEP) superfamily protein YafD
VILAGDFNANADSRTLGVFSQAPWTVVPKVGHPATHPSEKPTDEIDFTVVRGLTTVKSTVVIPETVASDHRPLLTIVAKPD